MKKGYLIIYLIFVVIIFILPNFSAEGYSLIKHSTSQLGAQATRNAFIMNFAFVLIALATLTSSVAVLKRNYYFIIVITVFSLSLIGSAIYSHAPIDSGLSYSVFEDKLHSFYASLTGFSFVTYACSSIFITENVKDKVIGFSVGLIALLLSILIFTLPELKGIFQRLMFVVSFYWIYYFNYKVIKF